jgi:hypothetical protein
VSAFTAQLVLEEQRKMFAVWRDAAAGTQLPTQRMIQLRCFGALLPFVSITDVDESGGVSVRMVGSGLRDVFADEPRSWLASDTCPSGSGAMRKVFSSALPLAGSCPVGQSGQPLGQRFWMRLPLGASCGGTRRVESVLGLDVALGARRAPQWALDQITARA